MAQALTASLLFSVLDIRLTSFYGLFGSETLPLPVSYFITLFAVVGVTNSLNLIDGIDGLAATFAFVSSIFFGTWFFLAGNYPFAIICVALAGGILAFLFQNWEPSNIFMGDTGSLVIGTVLSVTMIQFINMNFALHQSDPIKFNSSVVTAICVMIIPLTDTVRVIIIRLIKGVSPFTADKRHIHHALLRLGLSHRQAVYVLTIAHIVMITIAIAFRKLDQWPLLAIVLFITIGLCLFLDRLLLKSLQREAS